jgi:murein DD-endopeptidase MepM/ murein hydrolase activator NlpD
MKKLSVFLLIIILPLVTAAFYFLDKVAFLCPIAYDGKMVVRCDSRGNGFFGAERNGRRQHEGIDLYAALGTVVLNPRLGKVIAAGRSRGMGKYVIIRHWGNLTTIYGHLSEIKVKKGQILRQGEVIGLVGKTGNANYRAIQPHLHFEVRYKGVPQDPLIYLQ